MPSATERARTSTTPVSHAIARVRLVCDETHDYLARPRVADPTLLDELGRLYGRLGKQVGHAIADAVTDPLLRSHKTSRQAVRRVAQGLVGLALRVAEGSGVPEAVLIARHPVVQSWASRRGEQLSLPTTRRAIAALVEAGVVLYVEGRSKHPSVWGFPWLVDECPAARDALIARRRELPGWAQAMVITLQESAPTARVFDLAAHVERYEARLAVEQAARRQAQLDWMERRGIDPKTHAAIIDIQRSKRQVAAEERRASTPRPDAAEPSSSRDHRDHRNSSPPLRKQPPECRSTPDRAREPSDPEEGWASPKPSPEAPAAPVADDDDYVNRAERIAAFALHGVKLRHHDDEHVGAPVPSAEPQARNGRPSIWLAKGGTAADGVSTGVTAGVSTRNSILRSEEGKSALPAGSHERGSDRGRESPLVSRQVGRDDGSGPPPRGPAS